MESLSYQQFIDEINEGKIIRAVFQVENYAHYNNCLIERVTDVLHNGNPLVTISVKLTRDKSEHVGFYKVFNEEFKLFKIGRQGKFTLKQMWDKIKFIEIDYDT